MDGVQRGCATPQFEGSELLMRLKMLANVRSVAAACLATAVLLNVTAGARAARLGPGGSGLPNTGIADVTTQYIGIQYTLDANPSTGTFHAGGDLQAYPDQFVADGNVAHQQFIDTGTSTFELTATLNRADGSLVSGSVTISGDILATPYAGPTYSGTLLQGTLTAFGFSTTAPGEFDFIFHVDSGALLAPYYTGQTAGMVMLMVDIGSPAYTGVFTSAFQNNLDNTNGQADTFAMVPEPSSCVLLGFGLISLAWQLRRRRRPATG